MKHKLGLPFPLRNLPLKFGTNPSTIFLIIVVTDRHTDTQTNTGKNLLPRFRGENNKHGETLTTAKRMMKYVKQCHINDTRMLCATH